MRAFGSAGGCHKSPLPVRPSPRTSGTWLPKAPPYGGSSWLPPPTWMASPTGELAYSTVASFGVLSRGVTIPDAASLGGLDGRTAHHAGAESQQVGL